MKDWEASRLTGAELKEFFHRLFPHGFAGADVVQEIAPEKWENSPLLACFHPSPKQIFEERLQLHDSAAKLGLARHETDSTRTELPPHPKPSMEEVLAEWKEQPINITEEVTKLVALCLWDVFSNNHKVVAADGRYVDIGSFRGASSFLDEYLTSPSGHWDCGDEYRFYMGSIWISRRADLTTVYRMILRRLCLFAADWEYHFPQVFVVDLSPLGQAIDKEVGTHSPSEAFAKEQEERERQVELQRARAELDDEQNQARRKAMDGAPPRTVRAYQEIYGRDPKGWPPSNVDYKKD